MFWLIYIFIGKCVYFYQDFYILKSKRYEFPYFFYELVFFVQKPYKWFYWFSGRKHSRARTFLKNLIDFHLLCINRPRINVHNLRDLISWSFARFHCRLVKKILLHLKWSLFNHVKIDGFIFAIWFLEHLLLQKNYKSKIYANYG